MGGELDHLKEKLRECGININMNGKKILDISGEPGLLAKQLEGVAERVLVTGYSQIAVDAMKKQLGIDAIKFDYNQDRLHEVIKDKFDIVLIRWSINFCLDLKAFAYSLRKLVHDDSIVYISFVPPTLGCCLRWQYDEYTYNILYHPETIARIFTEEGFILYCRNNEVSYHYTKDRNKLKALFTIPYLIAARRRDMNINRELIQKGLIQVFKVNNKFK